MEKKTKTHTMKIPIKIIACLPAGQAGFFTEAEKQLLEVHLVEVIGFDLLLVDVVYQSKQRMEMMLLIERVDDWYHKQEQQWNQRTPQRAGGKENKFGSL